MNGLLLFFLTALLLGWALLRFLRVDDARAFEETAGSSDSSAQSGSRDSRDFQLFGSAIFSEQDLDFIQKEKSASLTELFVQERRAVATHWLLDSALQIRALRAKHLRTSRYSKNLNVFGEARLLLLIFYLSVLCRFLVLVVRFAPLTTPRSLAMHFQRMASKLLAVQNGLSTMASGEQFASPNF